MTNVFDLLFKDKTPEDRPRICVIRTQSTVTPDEQLDYFDWCKVNRVGINVEHREGIDNAHSMMQLWDEDRKIDYYKNLKIG